VEAGAPEVLPEDGHEVAARIGYLLHRSIHATRQNSTRGAGRREQESP
jgi:hypothetical protein